MGFHDICERCKKWVRDGDKHLALPNGAKRLCAILTNLLGPDNWHREGCTKDTPHCPRCGWCELPGEGACICWSR